MEDYASCQLSCQLGVPLPVRCWLTISYRFALYAASKPEVLRPVYGRSTTRQRRFVNENPPRPLS